MLLPLLMGKIRKVLVLSFIAVVGISATYLLSGRLALEHYVSSLHAKGEKVRLEELYDSLSKNVPDTTGALTNVIARLGPAPAKSPALLELSEPGKATIAWQQSELIAGDTPTARQKSNQSNTNCSWQMLRIQLDKNSMALAELRKILQDPAANEGSRTDLFVVRLRVEPVRTACYWLTCSTLGDLHDGRRKEALDNLIALAGFADLHREEHNLMSQMTRVAVAGFGLKLTWEALQAGGWKDEDLRALQQSWEKVSLLEGFEKAVEGERGFGLEAERRFASSLPSSANSDSDRTRAASGWFYRNTFLAHDLKFGMQHWHGELELVRALRANEPYPDVLRSWQKLDGLLESKYHGPQKFLYLLSLISIPNTWKALQAEARTETERRLAITAIAIERYKLRYGHPPTTLDPLMPEFIGAIPRDCMSGRSLSYHLNPGGGFTLYSTGEDGVDNGGDPSPQVAAAKPDVWAGRDVVWPAASPSVIPKPAANLQTSAH